MSTDIDGLKLVDGFGNIIGINAENCASDTIGIFDIVGERICILVDVGPGDIVGLEDAVRMISSVTN